MSDVNFFQTAMGRRFYEDDIPRIARALERIAAALEKLAEQDDRQPTSEPDEEAAYQMCVHCSQPSTEFKLDPFSGEKVCEECYRELRQKFDALCRRP